MFASEGKGRKACQKERNHKRKGGKFRPKPKGKGMETIAGPGPAEGCFRNGIGLGQLHQLGGEKHED